MKNIDTLMEKAAKLKSEGLVEGQISEELNISRETVTWLLTHAEEKGDTPGPKDISVDWSTIGRNAYRLRYISQALTDMIYECLEESDESVDLVVGIALSGVPLANMVAETMEVDMAIYTPSKQRWSQENNVVTKGSFSANFADVKGKECVVVDDVITSGRTLEEAVKMLSMRGARTNAIGVILDKKGIVDIAGVSVRSLLKVIRVN